MTTDTLLFAILTVVSAMGLYRSVKRASNDEETETETYNETTSTPAFVLYHMNGCGYCERMKPEWNAFVQGMAKELPGAVTAASAPGDPLELRSRKLNIIALERARVPEEISVPGFPTIVFYPDGDIRSHDFAVFDSPNRQRDVFRAFVVGKLR